MPKHALIILLLSLLQSFAAVYHVAKSGNDTTGDGSSGNPWLTVAKGKNTAASGDTVIVHEGTYSETITTAANGVSFIGTNTPLITGWIIDNSTNEVNGFQILGTALSFAIRINSGGHYFRSINNVLTNNAGRSIQYYYTGPWGSNGFISGNRFWHGGDHALGLLGTGHTFTNNVMESTNGWDAIVCMADNTTIVGNTFTNWSQPSGSSQHTDIIQTFNDLVPTITSTNVVFERNFAINCSGTQIGNMDDAEETGLLNNWIFRNNLYVDVAGTINMYCPRVRWWHNTFIRSGNSSGSPLLFRHSVTKGSATEGEVFGNIFYECGITPTSTTGGFYGVDAGCSNLFRGDFNLVIGSGAGTTKTAFDQYGREPNGINGTDPDLVNVSGVGPLHFILNSTSPAINAGTNSTADVTTDYFLTSRPQGAALDIGAYEYQAGGGSSTYRGFQFGPGVKLIGPGSIRQ
jgi:hypothetical protein